MRAVVVGSGIAGMTAALLLAQQGHHVTVVEAAPRPAPLLHGFWRDGLRFDTGFHYGGGVHAGGVLHRWLLTLGILPKLTPEVCNGGINTAHEDHLYFSEYDTPFVFPSGYDAILDFVHTHFVGHTPTMQAIFAECEAIMGHSPYTNPSCINAPSLWQSTQHSVTQHLNHKALPKALQIILEARCLLYGVPPALATWDDYAQVAGPYFQSCGTWQGGGEALAHAFTARLREHDVTLLCRQKVVQLHATAKGIESVGLEDGSRISCEQCFFTGHPRQLEQLLPTGAVRPAYYNRIRALPETLPALLLFAETTALPAGHSRYLLPHGILAGDACLFAPVDAPSPMIYICCGHPAPDAPQQERVPMLVMAFMRHNSLPSTGLPRSAEYIAYKQAAVQTLAQHVTARCPELQNAWRIIDAATPATMQHWTYGSTGSVYGIRHDGENLPLLSVTRVPGLFLAGQNIVLPGVLGGMVSAALAVGFALGHDTILQRFRAC